MRPHMEPHTTPADGTVPAPLRRRFGLVVTFFTLLTAATTVVVARSFDPRTGSLWAVGAAVVGCYQLWFLGTSLARNRSTASEGIRATLGPANAVTLGRGWLYAAVAGFLLVVPPIGSGWRWVPFLCYGAGAALDAVDGFVARTVGRETELGEKLDMAFDTVGFLVAPLVGVVWGRLPVWYLSISAARYLFKLGRGWRRRRGKPVFDLPPSRVRRPLAGLQMAFIAWALLPLVPVAVVWPAAAVVVAPSLVVFGRDYLVVSGRFGGETIDAE